MNDGYKHAFEILKDYREFIADHCCMKPKQLEDMARAFFNFGVLAARELHSDEEREKAIANAIATGMSGFYSTQAILKAKMSLDKTVSL